MNKKAFTLVELLAVIVIVGITATLMLPKILERFEKKKIEISESAKEMLYLAADQYLDENANTDNSCITIGDLINSGQLVEPVLDVENNTSIPNTSAIIVAKINNQNQYFFSDNGCTFGVKFILKNVTTNSDIENTGIKFDDIKEIVFSADKDYILPDTVSVVGANHTWDPATGILVIKDAYSSVKITISAISLRHNLIVDLNGGTWSLDNYYELLEGETIQIETPTREGFIFGGWRLSNEDSSLENDIFTMGNTDTTLKAVWIAQEYVFDFTDNIQIFKAPVTGNYEIELWGASGNKGGHGEWSGGQGGAGGNGGYVKVRAHMNEGQEFNVIVGGTNRYSDGGEGKTPSNQYAAKGGSGGGSTYISLEETIYARANGGSGGGGGGGGCYNNKPSGQGGTGGIGGGGTAGGIGGYNANTCSNTNTGRDYAADGKNGINGSYYIDNTYAIFISEATTNNESSDPISGYLKSGNGYAKIKYIFE